MLIFYASKTGNVERFLKKTDIPEIVKINNGNEILAEDCILLTYTTGIGEMPEEVSAFVKNNHNKIKAVIGSGNKNWGSAFCSSAKMISEKYNIPNLMNFEMAGNTHDIAKFKEIHKSFD